MSSDMSDDLIRYDVLLQDALRSVVQRVLSEVQKTGLPGEHHFFIQFNTTAPGVRISSRLREQYPEEMTIVIQHQYWELAVGDHAFEVGLSFGGVPEKLVVPFSALRGFFDPSVQFGLQIDPETQSLDGSVINDLEANQTAESTTKKTLAVIEQSAQKTPAADSDDEQAAPGERADGSSAEPKSKPKKRSSKKAKASSAKTDDARSARALKGPSQTDQQASEADDQARENDQAHENDKMGENGDKTASADVVSLDSFRKRT